VNVNSSHLQSISYGSGAKTVATPVDSVTTDFDLEAYQRRRRRMAAVPETIWSPPTHIPYISSTNQCLLFAAHTHTITTCFAVISILYHLFLVFLSSPYLEFFYLNITHPSEPFSSLFAEVPPHLLSLARSHFHEAYYFAHNCYTASLS